MNQPPGPLEVRKTGVKADDCMRPTSAFRKREDKTTTPTVDGKYLAIRCPKCHSRRWRQVSRFNKQDSVYRYKVWFIVMVRCLDCGWYGNRNDQLIMGAD